MDLKELFGWTGVITVICRDLDGNETERHTFKNLITNKGKELMAKSLADSGLDTEIKYIALGDSTVAASVTDTGLGNERFRKAVTKQEYQGSNAMLTTVYIAPYEANFGIQEIGWYAGASASGTAGSGTLVARVLYSRTKTSTESIQFDRTDTFS